MKLPVAELEVAKAAAVLAAVQVLDSMPAAVAEVVAVGGPEAAAVVAEIVTAIKTVAAVVAVAVVIANVAE